MPRPKPWIGRIPQILKFFEESDQALFPRREIQEVFQIGRSAALELMSVIGSCTDAEHERLVSRPSLIRYLKHSPEAQAAEQEARRRAKLAQKLNEAATHAAARAVQLPVERNADFLLKDLANVSIENGEMRVVFTDALDLLAQLYKLSQVAMRDWLAFEKVCEVTNERPEDQS